MFPTWESEVRYFSAFPLADLAAFTQAQLGATAFNACALQNPRLSLLNLSGHFLEAHTSLACIHACIRCVRPASLPPLPLFYLSAHAAVGCVGGQRTHVSPLSLPLSLVCSPAVTFRLSKAGFNFLPPWVQEGKAT